MVGLLICLALPRHGEALPDRHVRLCFCHQRVSDVLFATSRPALIVLLTQRPDGHVSMSSHEFARSGRRLGSDCVNIELEFFAISFKRQIIDVVAKWILNFTADSGKTDDDVCGKDAPRNCDPAQIVPKLKGQHHDVNPGDLGNGDGVGNGEGSLKHAIHASEGFVELDDTGDYDLVNLDFEK